MLAPYKQMTKQLQTRIESKHNFTERNKNFHKLPNFMNPSFNPEDRLRSVAREGRLDINEFLVSNPKDTFLIRVTGNSMTGAGIASGDMLVVDRRKKADEGKIVVASINNQLVVKRLTYVNGVTVLQSENRNYSPITVGATDDLEIWGVVTSVIKAL